MTVKKEKENKSAIKGKNIEDVKHQRNPLVSSLESFGLSKNEAIIYIHLLERGVEVGGSKIALGTQLHRQYVYNSLPTLLELGLIVEIEKGMQSRYKAVAPNQVEKIAKRKALEASDLADQLKKISKIGHEQDFEVIIGEQSFIKYELERSSTLPIGSSQYIIGVSADRYMYIMKDAHYKYAKNLKDRNIKTYYLGGENAPEIYNTITYHFERRTMPSIKLQYMSMVISQGRLAFYGNLDPISIYSIHSDKIAQDYKDFFMMLWEMAGNQQ